MNHVGLALIDAFLLDTHTQTVLFYVVVTRDFVNYFRTGWIDGHVRGVHSDPGPLFLILLEAKRKQLAWFTLC